MSKRGKNPAEKPETGWQTYEQKKDAIEKYMSKMAHIRLTVRPELKVGWQERAEAEGKSLTQYIVDSVEMPMKWIRCRDHLPEERQKVLTVSKSGEFAVMTFQTVTETFDEEDSAAIQEPVEKPDYVFYPNDDINEENIPADNSPCFELFPAWSYDPITAWMPLPAAPDEGR